MRRLVIALVLLAGCTTTGEPDPSKCAAATQRLERVTAALDALTPFVGDPDFAKQVATARLAVLAATAVVAAVCPAQG